MTRGDVLALLCMAAMLGLMGVALFYGTYLR